MTPTFKRINEYVDALVPKRHPELRKMERIAAQSGFPIIGPACGYVCYQLTRAIGARRVFEMGSGYGYSTAFFARGVQENGGGTVHHVVWDETLSSRARKHLGVLGYGDVVSYHVAEAIATLEQTEGPFDIIFNDIEKDGYPRSLPAIEAKLRPGGLLIVDNMLWHGAVFDEADRKATTRGVRTLTREITTSPKWIASLLPIRDGLMVALRA
jgi:predicted O-methyltransferase YrrM